MTIEAASRNPTLADVLARISVMDIAEKKRTELISALRTVGRVLNRPLDQIAADSKSLRRRLNEISPETAGVSPGRWANIRSLLRKALVLANFGASRMPKVPMLAEWSTLFRQLPNESARFRLSRMLRYLSGAGIGPEAVASEQLMTFGEALLGDPLIKDPGFTWRNTAWAWNTASRTIVGWPHIQISIQSRRETYTLPSTSFPQSFKYDVDAFLKRIAGTDLLAELPFRPVRPSTCRTREHQLYVAASALVHRGRDPASIRSLADLVTLDAFKEILRFFIERNGSKSSTAIEQLAGFLKSVARHWVRVDPPVLNQMTVIVKRIAVPQQGMTPKNRERLRPFQQEDNVAALLHLPARLMKEAASGRYRPFGLHSSPKSLWRSSCFWLGRYVSRTWCSWSWIPT
jgi:hypothetical protein